MESILQVRQLTKRYGPGCPDCHRLTGPYHGTNQCPRCRSIIACNKVSFDLHTDEILGIVGESGSGKSTVIRLLHFDFDATAGDVFINLKGFSNSISTLGITKFIPETTNLLDLCAFQKRRIRNEIMGIVYQNPQLGLRMKVSAGGNIVERLLMIGKRNIGYMRQRSEELLIKTEVPVERMDDRPDHFSGGMQQRIQIAKALSINPSILLLDEVTTGLDVSVQARVLDLIRSLQNEFRVATIVVSHDLGVIRLLTSRTLVMRYGCVVEQGLTDQILEDPQDPYTQLLVNSTL